MNKNINGKLVSEILFKEINNYLKIKDKVPNIVSIQVGNNLANKIYSTMIKKTLSKETNIKYEDINFDYISYQDLKKYIEKLNNDKEITGIMLELPLPDYLKEYERDLIDTIDKNKDIEGITSINAGLLSTSSDCLIPCTALGIETLLKVYDVPLSGNKVAIINRSNIIGKPLANLLLRNNTTPIICHSKTNNLQEITSNSNIIIAALNKPEYITNDYIKEGAIVIDAGVHKNNLGQIVGDVNYQNVINKVSLITPPTASVGPMTICLLAYNSAKALYGLEVNTILDNAINKAKTIIKNN